MRFLLHGLFALAMMSEGAGAAPLFLQLKGQVPSGSDDQIYNNIHATFLAPLEGGGGAILFSQLSQAYGDGYFFLNLIVEEGMDPGPLRAYVASLEGQVFSGVKIHFQKVLGIDETAELEAGTYVDNREDPFQQNFQLSKTFSFASLQDWLDFTNAYGYALMAKDNSSLMDYIRMFIGDPKEFVKYRDGALSVSNMMAIFPQVTLRLGDGSVSGPGFDQTPFLPFRFFRNCYSSRYESGMCWKAAP